MSSPVDWRNPIRGWSLELLTCVVSFCGPGVLIHEEYTGWLPLYVAFCVGVIYTAMCSRNNVRWSRPWALVAGSELETGPICHEHMLFDSNDRKNWELLKQFPAWRWTTTGMCRVRFLYRRDAVLFRLQAQGPVRLLAAATPPI